MARPTVVFLTSTILAANVAFAQDPPKVVQLEPAHGAVEVDAQKTTTLVIRFDQAMRRSGHSFCGGGPRFPKITKGPRWKDRKTMVVEVALEPDHTYRMSLNCPAAKNFRSAKGRSLVPTPWSFSTLPAKLLSKKEQRVRNRQALDALQTTLAAKDLYYEHSGLDWKKLFGQHENAVLSARTDRGWATAVGKLLEPANDLHMYLRVGGATIGTGSRRIDPLYRARLLKRYFEKLEQPVKDILTAKSKDGIAYLMISGWNAKIDFAKVEELIVDMKSARALIVDVRPNSGGGENLARQVAQWFVSGTKTYAKHVTRVGKGAKNFSPVRSRNIRGKSRKERFGKPVAVLMSRYCMSSCEAFLLMMKQAEHCKLIGQKSYGSSGNPKSHALPNGVELVLPSWKAMRVDGTCFEGEGVKPDIEVVPTAEELETRDPILERALDHLRKQK